MHARADRALRAGAGGDMVVGMSEIDKKSLDWGPSDPHYQWPEVDADTRSDIHSFLAGLVQSMDTE